MSTIKDGYDDEVCSNQARRSLPLSKHSVFPVLRSEVSLALPCFSSGPL
jgi:hypothetical protein